MLNIYRYTEMQLNEYQVSLGKGRVIIMNMMTRTTKKAFSKSI